MTLHNNKSACKWREKRECFQVSRVDFILRISQRKNLLNQFSQIGLVFLKEVSIIYFCLKFKEI